MKLARRIISLAAAVLILAALLCSCGRYASHDSAAVQTAPAANPEEALTVYNSGYSGSTYSFTAEAAEAESYSIDSIDSIDSAELSAVSDRKLIYTYNLSIETLDYAGSVAAIPALAKSFGGYVESSYVEDSGINYENSYRCADYTLRIPGERIAEFIARCGDESIGVITSQQCSTDDRTATYIDLSARLETLEIEEESLNALLAEAENVDTVVALTERLSEVRYEIESINASLRNIDSLVEYSTVYINLQEVIKISKTTDDTPRTFSERLSARFAASLESFTSEVQNIGVYLLGEFPLQFVTFLIYAMPIILIALVVILIISSARRRHRAKAPARRAAGRHSNRGNRSADTASDNDTDE